MGTDVLVASRDQAIENIHQYQVELQDKQLGESLRRLMPHVHAWYATETETGDRLFAPSKFVGYVDNTADSYFLNRAVRDGRKTERALQRWFRSLDPGSRRSMDLTRALQYFLVGYEHLEPRKGARILIPTEGSGRAATRQGLADRIHFHPEFCAGRPHIRRTRVRVSDILQLMASGASVSDFLRDYPYLKKADLMAALAYGAGAIDHRVILATWFMRFLIDVQLLLGSARWLSERGHTCVHVNDLGPGSATDDQIGAWARESQAIVWSGDADFAVRARQGSGLPAVWLRLGNTTNAAPRARLTP